MFTIRIQEKETGFNVTRVREGEGEKFAVARIYASFNDTFVVSYNYFVALSDFEN